jgi:hypothetical protein
MPYQIEQTSDPIIEQFVHHHVLLKNVPVFQHGGIYENWKAMRDYLTSKPTGISLTPTNNRGRPEYYTIFGFSQNLRTAYIGSNPALNPINFPTLAFLNGQVGLNTDQYLDIHYSIELKAENPWVISDRSFLKKVLNHSHLNQLQILPGEPSTDELNHLPDSHILIKIGQQILPLHCLTYNGTVALYGDKDSPGTLPTRYILKGTTPEGVEVRTLHNTEA